MNLLKPVTRYGLVPGSLLNDFDTQMSRMFDRDTSRGTFSPAVDLHETDEAFVIEADLPGMNKDDIEIEVAENVVTLKGKRKEEVEEENKNFHRVERVRGEFQRSFRIPGGFEHEGVKADFKEGVITVTLPKPTENKPKRIQVK